jgi:hypothetical protein
VSRFRPPVRRGRNGYVVNIADDELDLLRRLLGELRGLLTDPDVSPDAPTSRLFPPAHRDDPEQEAEYQRFMRDDLVASRLAALDAVEGALGANRQLDESEITGFMQSINSLRLVLGTILGVSDDPEADEVAAGAENTAEYQLYGYLSWLLEWTVRAMSSS